MKTRETLWWVFFADKSSDNFDAKAHKNSFYLAERSKKSSFFLK